MLGHCQCERWIQFQSLVRIWVAGVFKEERINMLNPLPQHELQAGSACWNIISQDQFKVPVVFVPLMVQLTVQRCIYKLGCESSEAHMAAEEYFETLQIDLKFVRVHTEAQMVYAGKRIDIKH